jgi:hypothetical protein
MDVFASIYITTLLYGRLVIINLAVQIKSTVTVTVVALSPALWSEVAFGLN